MPTLHEENDNARRLLLVRHGACDARGYLGATDLPLNATGRAQSAALRPLLEKQSPTRVFCSPLKRCIETAALALPGATPEILHDLREINFGRWEGKPFEVIAAAEPQAVQRWAEFAPDFGFPGGETIGGFLDRVESAIQIMTAAAAPCALAFTHGGVIAATLCRLLGLQPRQYVLFQIKRASLTTVNLFDGCGVLAGLNERVEISNGALPDSELPTWRA